jgi:putative acyl-CoA dehydrogenase
VTRPQPHVTHEVTNQAPPREGVDEYADFPVLRRAVRAFGGAWGDDHLHDVGRLVGSAGFQADAERANRCTPELRTFDRWGRRVDEVDYDPAYHRVLGAAVAHGAHTSAWTDPRPGANVVRAAVFSLFAQVEPGHACPVSMSHAAVPSLAHAPALADVWVPRLLSREYDGALAPFSEGPGGKRGALFGMAMTEKQGGSDVRAGTTLARPAAGDGSSGDSATPYLLTGHKWFCSAPMSDAFLVLARVARRAPSGEERPDDDVSCFLVPRRRDDGSLNGIEIQRLKDKLGNRSNASSEIELDSAVGHLVGDEGRGVPTIIQMVNHTRLDCVLGASSRPRSRSRGRRARSASAAGRRAPCRTRSGARHGAAPARPPAASRTTPRARSRAGRG